MLLFPLVVGLGIAISHSGALINETNYRKLSLGMPLAKVVSILGAPADYSTKPRLYREIFRPNPRAPMSWTNDKMRINVFFDEFGCLSDCERALELGLRPKKK